MFAIINVEPSGIDTNSDVILEIGAIKTDFKDQYEEFHKVYDEKMLRYFKDEKLSFDWNGEIKECKSRIKSLGSDMLKEFEAFIQGCKVICYYSKFDTKFLEKYGIETNDYISVSNHMDVSYQYMCMMNGNEYSIDGTSCVKNMYKYIKNHLKELHKILYGVPYKDKVESVSEELQVRDVIDKIKSISDFKSSSNALFIDAQDRFQLIKGEMYELRLFSFLIKGEKEKTFLSYATENDLLTKKLKKSSETDLIEVWYYALDTEDAYIILSLRKVR